MQFWASASQELSQYNLCSISPLESKELRNWMLHDQRQYPPHPFTFTSSTTPLPRQHSYKLGLGCSYVIQMGPQFESHSRASPVAQTVKNLPEMHETWVWSLGWEDPLEKGMATDSNILAWRITWTEKPGGRQFMGSQRVRQDWATFSFTRLWGWFWRKPLCSALT